MDADRFSLKARRTTRIPLRIPVLVVIEENGKSRTLDGWTMIVNVHGAKIECKHRFGMHEEVTIQVPFNGMSQKGKVVWSKLEPNANGNYEFGVELNQPENLWGVGFPPSDWEASRGSKAETATAAILDLAPPGVTRPRNPSNEDDPSPTEQDGLSGNEENRPQSDYSTAPENLVEFLDLSAEFSALNTEEQSPPPPGCTIEFSEMQMSPQEEEAPMPNAEIRSEAAEVQNVSGWDPCGEAEEFDVTGFLPGDLSVPHPSPVSGAMGQLNPTDKLSAFFNELVDSVLQARVLGLIEGVGKQIERRVNEIENSTVSRIEEQIQNTGNRHSDSMERRAIEYVAAQQQALEQKVRNYLAEAEDGARQRQQEQLGQSKQAMQEEMAALLQTNVQRLDEHASDLITTTQLGLRSSMEQQLPAIEKDMLERCRVQGERMMAAQLEQWTLLFSDRVRDAQQSMEKRLDETLNAVYSRHAAALDARLEEHLAQAGARLEQQLTHIGTQVRQTFLRHIVTELGRSQQVWVQQSQRQLDKMASANLERSRRSLAQYMRRFGEFLMQQAAITEDNSTEPAPEVERQAELPLAESRSEVPSETQY